MRRIEPGIDVALEGMARLADLVAENTPLLGGHTGPADAMMMFDHGMRREAGAKNGRDIIHRPANDLHQWVPEVLLLQIGIGDVGAGDDQGVQTLTGEVLEVEVVRFNMCLGFVAAIELG